MKLLPLFISCAIVLSACGGDSSLSEDPEFKDADDNSDSVAESSGIDSAGTDADTEAADVETDTGITENPTATETPGASAFVVSNTSWKSDCEISPDGRSRSTLLQFTETDFIDRLEIYDGPDCQGEPVDTFGSAGSYQVTGNSTTASDGLSIFEVSFSNALTAEPIGAVFYYIDLFTNAIYPAFDEGQGLEIDYEQPLFRDSSLDI